MHLKGGVDKLDLSEVRGCAVEVLTHTSQWAPYRALRLCKRGSNRGRVNGIKFSML